MDDTGDFIIVWETNTGTDRELFMRRFPNLIDDAAGTVTEVRQEVGSDVIIVEEEDVLENEVAQLVVTLGENMLTELGASGQFSIENPDNWRLTRSGVEMPDSIAEVTFSLNSTTGKYEAIVTFDAEPETPGYQPLQNGRYALMLRQNVQDMFGNYLDGDFNGYQDDEGFTAFVYHQHGRGEGYRGSFTSRSD